MMTYIGMVIDESVSGEWPEVEIPRNFMVLNWNEWQMEERIKVLITWPGQRIADDLICKVC